MIFSEKIHARLPVFTFGRIVLLTLYTAALLVNFAPALVTASPEFTVVAVEGGTAELPCSVDVSSCGDVYFLTWTKNTSGEGKRIYLYSDSVEKPLQELANPDRADFIILESSAFLRITPVQMVDEGAYVCDVTYLRVKENCPSLSQATLIIHAPPSKPIILYKGQMVPDGATVGPFLEGSHLQLECTVRGGRPRPSVGWWRGGDEAMPAQERYDSDSEVITVDLDLDLGRDNLGDVLECRAINPALPEGKPHITAVKVNVQVRPKAMEIEAPSGPLIAGRPVYFVCKVEGAKPAANVTWYNGTSAFQGGSPSYHTMPDGTFRTERELEVSLTSYDHGGTFYCKGTNVVLQRLGEDPLLKSTNLRVLYPPNVIMGPEDGLIVTEGSEATVYCRYEANPPNMTDVDWYKGDTRLPVREGERGGKYEQFLPGEELGTAEEVDFPTLVIHNITHLDRGMYSCGVSNMYGTGNSTNLVEISVLYSPRVKVHIFPPKVQELDDTMVTLLCEVVEGNPLNLLGVRWYQGDGTLIYETSEHEISWQPIYRNFTGNYSCQGQNTAGWGERSEDGELQVEYLPGMAQVISLGSYVVRGEYTTLVCDLEERGKPPAENFRWEFNGHVLDEISDNLRVGPARMDTQGNYSCAGVNSVGIGPEGHFHMAVYAPPTFVDDLPEKVGVSKDAKEVSFFCTVECEPPCSISWLKNGVPINELNGNETDEDDDYQDERTFFVETAYRPRLYKEGSFASVTSTLHLNGTTGFLRGRDDANYTCLSSGNEVGGPVSSTTILTVEFAPTNITLSKDRLNVKEGDEGELVTCSANSWPPSKYLWIQRDRIISDEPWLFLNKSMTRNLSGLYMCEASNIHGKVSAPLHVNVQYPPTCVIEESKDDKGRRSQLVCRVRHANPAGVNFTWTRGNRTQEQSANIVTERWSSTLTLPANDRHGTYTCLVTNVVGTSEPCEHTITGYLGLAGTVPEEADKKMFIIASVIGGIAILFVLIIIVMIIIMRRKRMQEAAAAKNKSDAPLYQNMAQDGTKENGGQPPEDGESKAMYENMPFHRKTGPFRPDTDEMLYADVYDDVKAGKIPDPRVKPPLPPKGIGKKPKEPPLPPKTKKKGETEEILGIPSKK